MRVPKGIKIKWAPHGAVDGHAHLAEEFFHKILGMDYKEVLITDESSIYDFDFNISGGSVNHRTKTTLNKIKKVYGVDVSKVEGLILVDIFKKIKDNQQTT